MTGLVADRKQILSAALFRLVCWLLYMLDPVADCPDSGSGLFLSVGVVLHMVFVYSVLIKVHVLWWLLIICLARPLV